MTTTVEVDESVIQIIQSVETHVISTVKGFFSVIYHIAKKPKKDAFEHQLIIEDKYGPVANMV
jgi:hypothetical protein